MEMLQVFDNEGDTGFETWPKVPHEGCALATEAHSPQCSAAE
jgi:hypothetical protein